MVNVRVRLRICMLWILLEVELVMRFLRNFNCCEVVLMISFVCRFGMVNDEIGYII